MPKYEECNTAHLVMIGFQYGMAELECSNCGATIYVHEDFIERHKYCFCCGKKFVIDEDEYENEGEDDE